MKEPEKVYKLNLFKESVLKIFNHYHLSNANRVELLQEDTNGKKKRVIKQNGEVN